MLGFFASILVEVDCRLFPGPEGGGGSLPPPPPPPPDGLLLPPPPLGGPLLPPGGLLLPPPVTFEVLTVVCLVDIMDPAVGAVAALVF